MGFYGHCLVGCSFCLRHVSDQKRPLGKRKPRCAGFAPEPNGLTMWPFWWDELGKKVRIK